MGLWVIKYLPLRVCQKDSDFLNHCLQQNLLAEQSSMLKKLFITKNLTVSPLTCMMRFVQIFHDEKKAAGNHTLTRE